MTFVWETLTWETDSSFTHLGDWTEGFMSFLGHPLGVGLGSTDFVAARFGLTPLTADNQYLRYAVEMGGLGLLLHLAVLGGALAVGVRAFATSPGSAPGRDYGLLLAVTTFGIALNAVTAVVFNSMMLAYPFFWLAGAVTTLAVRPKAAAL
jgi:O-antigen ligase